jgi:hypothetical protein
VEPETRNPQFDPLRRRDSAARTNSNGGEMENEENWGGRLSTNFANFREFSGEEILTADDADFERFQFIPKQCARFSEGNQKKLCR